MARNEWFRRDGFGMFGGMAALITICPGSVVAQSEFGQITSITLLVLGVILGMLSMIEMPAGRAPAK